LLVLYGLFFASGVAALIYQVMWMRSFSLVFGSTSHATAAVLGAFFAGLAVGSLLGAKLADSRSAALWRYGIAEILIGAGALLVPAWLWLLAALYPALYGMGDAALTASKLALALVAMGIPCVAMGTTLPLITRALVSASGHVGRRAGVAYGLNTLGATGGVLLAGFVLPPSLGTRWSIYLAVAINVAVGVVAMAISRRRFVPGAAGAEEGSEAASRPARTDPAVLVLVAASGFGTVALEVLYSRLLVNITDSSVFSFALMLASFLVFLALASLVVSRVVDRVENPWKLLAWSQSLGVVAILVAPSVLKLSPAREAPSLGAYLPALALHVALFAGPSILLIGIALPVAWKLAARRAAETGSRVGRLTSLNTLGAVAGSVIAGFVLVPLLGVSLSIALIALFYCGVALLAWLRGYGVVPAFFAGLALAVAFTGLMALQTVRAVVLFLGPGQEVVRLIEGESVNVAVVEDPTFGRILKVNNGYTLGRSDPLAVAMQRNQAGLPLLLRGRTDSMAFIGVGTGVSLSPVLGFPVDRVVALELLAEVVEATAFFDKVNLGVLDDERVETLVVDGRNHLFATAETFDAIVGDLFVPWQAGTGYLYTREHFESVAARLEDHGMFVQWLPAHQLAVEEFRMITATFLEVFPAAELWLSQPASDGLGSLALVSSSGPQPSPTRGSAESSTAFPGLRYLCGARTLERWSAGAPYNTDEFPRLEFSGAVTRFRAQENAVEMAEAISRLRER
jgi:spermidine synthase